MPSRESRRTGDDSPTEGIRAPGIDRVVVVRDTAGMNESETPDRRRWFQFRLRTLLIAVLVLSLPLSWFAVRMERARRQKEAVRAIERLNGRVMYRVKVPFPKSLHRLLGHDFFDTVAGVDFNTTEVTDSGLEHLRKLDTDSLQILSLNCPQITDAGLDHVQHLTNLEYLGISNSRITDTGLVRLKGLTNLAALIITDTRVTPEGVQKLQEALPNCEIEY